MPTRRFVGELFGWSKGVPNIADGSSRASRAIAEAIFRELGVEQEVTQAGQTAGTALEDAVYRYLHDALPTELHGRLVGVSRATSISDFAQYEHLATLGRLIADDETATLRAAIGTDYQIKPDVTVGLVDDGDRPLTHLHAAVPCKWTLRSDRAQNVRHEAVVLIRHRRGRLPHIVPVTAEPMPSRLASLARGTGEVDALYHVALDALEHAVHSVDNAQQTTILEELMGHDRLRDLSDLPETLTL